MLGIATLPPSLSAMRLPTPASDHLFDGLGVADAEHRDVFEALLDHLFQHGHRILCPA